MNTRKWSQGGIGLAAAVLAALSVTACDPFIAANTSAPVVLGVIVADPNTYITGAGDIPPFFPETDGCTAPYLTPNKAWADVAFPGLCDPDAIGERPTVCPVPCYPPRTGPGFAPLFQGNIGGSYQGDGPLNTVITVPYELQSTYVVRNVPTETLTSGNATYQFAQIRVLFNKLMDPATIQPNPDDSEGCIPFDGPGGPRISKVSPPTSTATPEDVTVDFSICYEPNSAAQYWGASISFTPFIPYYNYDVPGLDPDTRYIITANVKDQQGNSVPVSVEVITDPAPVVSPALRPR